MSHISESAVRPATTAIEPVAQNPGAPTGSGNTVATLVATFFGGGLFPLAPGTCAAAAAVLFGWIMQSWFGWGPPEFCFLVVVTIGPAVWASGIVAKDRRTRDPDMVVVDEVIGQWVALAGVATLDWSTALLAFLFFRFFDVWKPPPVRQLEKLRGGFGIVADDVMAGAYSALALYLVSQWQIVLSPATGQ